MKTTMSVDEMYLPRGKSFRTAFFKGALAWRCGDKETDNPYPDDGRWGSRFHRQWSRGWVAANSGNVIYLEGLLTDERGEVVFAEMYRGGEECKLP